MIPGSANPLLLASAAGGYNISRSIRLNAPDSGYLSRTPASAGNRKTWTWAGWVKRSALGIIQALMTVEGNSDSTTAQFWFSSDDKFRFGIETADIFITNAVFRDCSAWYHIVFAFDATNATSADKMILYVNGVRQTTSTYTAPSNTDYGFNRASAIHSIGRRQNNADWYLNGYLADVYLIDGQQLTPSAFGEFSATTGVWVPNAFSGGSYGTNGFHLDFADNASTTTIGYDAAGSNDWTPNNLSVTAGAGNDSLVDVPTNGSEVDNGLGNQVRGNYCTLNPLFSSATLTNGNLDAEGPSNAWHIGRGTIALPASDKWYWEATVTGTASASYAMSVATASAANSVADFTTGTGYYGIVNNTGTTINKVSNGSATVISTAAAWTQNDILMCAYDGATGKVWFGRNGTWYPPTSGGSAGNPAAGTNETMTASGTVFPAVHCYGTSADMTANFGARPFAYPLSGFKALCTANLPAPLVTKPSDVMDVLTWTGNSASSRALTGLGFSPDFVWIKDRSNGYNHVLFDAVRGAGGSKVLFSNRTTAEGGGTGEEGTNYGALTSFDSTGFTLQPGAVNSVWVNQSSDAYVGWAWDAGNTTVTNTQGSITSQVRANVSAGFSIVSWTGNATNGATVGHGLGVKPHLVIYKNRTDVDNWPVLSDVLLGSDGYLYLNSTAAKATAPQIAAPTSSVLTLPSYNDANGNGDAMIAYCFAPVAGYSSFGSYTGNGSADGPFVYTGFRPRWIMLKRTDSTSSWAILDATRLGYNVRNDSLYANLSDAEANFGLIDILSNGFKLRATYSSENGGTHIYAAFAESPFAANNRAR